MHPSRAGQLSSTVDTSKVIDHLKAAAEYSRASEPGVQKYMILVPQDKSDTKTVWAIEEYDLKSSRALSVADARQQI